MRTETVNKEKMMRFQEFQVNAEVSAYIEANRGDMTRARFTHELLKEYVKQLSQGEQFSNDTTNNKAR